MRDDITSRDLKRGCAIYHLFEAKWAMKTIEECCLKVSLPKNVNDPFEMLPFCDIDRSSVGSRQEAEAEECKWQKKVSERYGFVSFTVDPTVSAMWSHYADRHTGMALGFTQTICPPDRSIIPVDYSDMRFRPDYGNDPAMKERRQKVKEAEVYVARKCKSWSYERECRILVDLEKDCKVDANHYFLPFKSSTLAFVYIGWKSTISTQDVQHLLNKVGARNVVIRQACPNKGTFSLTMCPQRGSRRVPS